LSIFDSCLIAYWGLVLIIIIFNTYCKNLNKYILIILISSIYNQQKYLNELFMLLELLFFVTHS